MHNLLNTMHQDRAACTQRLGKAAFARIRQALQAPLGVDPLVDKAHKAAEAAEKATETGAK